MLRLAALLSTVALPVLAETPKVVVDIAPVHALVTQVMEGGGSPELLLEQDANPHAVQLRPSQARMLSEADLVIWVGPELSPWLERAITSFGAPDQIVLMDEPETTLREFGGHDDDHDHTHGADDPHVWLSIDNARAWVTAFADDLATRDPENAAVYRANAQAADARLAALHDRIETELAPFAGAEIVTFHASMGYFTDSFGLDVAGSVRPGDAATPSAAAIGALEALVAEHGVRCAFAEPGFDPALLDAIAGDTGLQIETLDPTGVLQIPGPDHYEATLQAAADTIARCLAGD